MKTKDPVVIDADRLRLSFTGADTYLRCGKQYEFRYIDDIKAIPAVALIEGSSHHKAMELNNITKRDKGMDCRPNRLTEEFMSSFRERVKAEEQVDWGGEDEDKIYSRAKILHQKYVSDVAPGINPVEVEKRFELPLTLEDERRSNPVDVLLTGVLDLEVPEIIFDYKTVAKSRGQGEADSSLQLSLYAYAAKKSQVGIIEFVKKNNPEVGVLLAPRTAQSKIWALKVLRSVAMAINAKVFPLASPNTWICSERFCGYWSRCRGKFT